MFFFSLCKQMYYIYDATIQIAFRAMAVKNNLPCLRFASTSQRLSTTVSGRVAVEANRRCEIAITLMPMVVSYGCFIQNGCFIQCVYTLIEPLQNNVVNGCCRMQCLVLHGTRYGISFQDVSRHRKDAMYASCYNLWKLF